MTRRWVTLCVGMTLWFAAAASPAPVQAQGRDTRETVARSAFDDGLRLAAEGRYREAREALLRSYALIQRNTTLLNLIVAELRLGLLEAAYQRCQALLDKAQKEGDERALARGGRLRDEILTLVGQLELSVSPADAQLVIDTTPSPAQGPQRTVVLMPGSHKLRLTAEGHQAGSWDIEVRAGEKTERALVLTPNTPVSSPPPPPPEPDKPNKPSADETRQVEPKPRTAPSPSQAARSVAPRGGKPAVPPRDSGKRMRRALWISAAAVVVAGAALGLALGLRDRSSSSCFTPPDGETLCPTVGAVDD